MTDTASTPITTADRLAELESRIGSAEKSLADAKAAVQDAAGRLVLKEIGSEELAEARQASFLAHDELDGLLAARSMLQYRLTNEQMAADEKATAGRNRKGMKLDAAEDAALLDVNEFAASTSAAIHRRDAIRAQKLTLRAEEREAVASPSRLAQVDEELERLANDAPNGQVANPVHFERLREERVEAIQLEAEQAADAVATIGDDRLLRAAVAAAGLDVARLLGDDLRRALGGGRELVQAPGVQDGRKVTRLWSTAEMPQVMARWVAFEAALNALSEDVPTLAESRTRGIAQGVTVGAA